MPRRDYKLAALAGLLIGLLVLPVLRAVKPEILSRCGFVTVPLFLIATPLGLAVVYSISRKIAVIWEIGKFAVTGVLNVLVDWGVLTSLIFLFKQYFGIESWDSIISGITFYSLYKASSFIVGNINSYYWNRYWTFDVQKGENTKAAFLQFFVVSIVGLLTNVLVASFVFKSILPVRGLTIDQWGVVGAAAGSVAGTLWNFLGYKFVVFKEL
jgi:putative flippase GtrA